jgi:hypothetical protein
MAVTRRKLINAMARLGGAARGLGIPENCAGDGRAVRACEGFRRGKTVAILGAGVALLSEPLGRFHMRLMSSLIGAAGGGAVERAGSGRVDRPDGEGGDQTSGVMRVSHRAREGDSGLIFPCFQSSGPLRYWLSAALTTPAAADWCICGKICNIAETIGRKEPVEQVIRFTTSFL